MENIYIRYGEKKQSKKTEQKINNFFLFFSEGEG